MVAGWDDVDVCLIHVDVVQAIPLVLRTFFHRASASAEQVTPQAPHTRTCPIRISVVLLSGADALYMWREKVKQIGMFISILMLVLMIYRYSVCNDNGKVLMSQR